MLCIDCASGETHTPITERQSGTVQTQPFPYGVVAEELSEFRENERSESTGGDMALTMTAHYLRNNPIHPGLHFRVLIMLLFVSGRFDHASFAVS